MNEVKKNLSMNHKRNVATKALREALQFDDDEQIGNSIYLQRYSR